MNSKLQKLARGKQKQIRKAPYLQQGIPDATTTSGDRRVVFSPKSERAAVNKSNWTLVMKMLGSNRKSNVFFVLHVSELGWRGVWRLNRTRGQENSFF